MKILVVNFEYPPLGGGGGDVSRELAKQYSSKGHEVKVFTAWHKDLPKTEIDCGVEVMRVFSFRKNRATSSFFVMAMFLFFGWWPYLKFVKKFKPDIVHVHFGVPTGFLGWLSKMIYKVPYIITGHLGDVPGALPEQTNFLFKIFYIFSKPLWNSASGVFGVSRALTDLIDTVYPKTNAKFIPNGVDVDYFKPPTIYKDNNKITILFAGRLNKQKDLSTLLKALSSLKKENPNLPWRLKIAGDGPMMEAWKTEAKNLLGERVDFLGWVNRDEILKQMQSSDIFSLSSIKEGMPIVVLQAMSVGLPIVATATEGTTEIIDNNVNGLLIAVGDSVALKEVLLKALTDKELRKEIGSKARYKAISSYSWSIIADQYLESFHKIIEVGPTFYFGRLITYNRGDLASRAGALDAFRNIFPDSTYYMLTVEPQKDANYYNIKPVKLGWIKDIIPHPSAIRAMISSDYLIWSGGVDLQDDTSKIKIPYVFFKFVIFQIFKCRIVIYAQGMGPIVSNWGSWWVRRVCALANKIIVRDEDSKNILIKCKVTQDVHVSADAALAEIPDPIENGVKILQKIGLSLERPIIGIAIRRWFHHSSDWLPYEYRKKYSPNSVKGINEMGKLMQLISQAADRLIDIYNVDVLFIPMYPDQPEWWEDDGAIADEMRDSMTNKSNAYVYHGTESPRLFAAMMSNLDFMIGMRLHSTIIATHQRVPSIHVCYTQKGRSYFERLNCGDVVFNVGQIIETEHAEKFIKSIIEAYNHREVIMQKMEPGLKYAEDLAEYTPQLIKDC